MNVRVRAQIQEMDEKKYAHRSNPLETFVIKSYNDGMWILNGLGINLINGQGEIITLYLSLLFLIFGAIMLFSEINRMLKMIRLMLCLRRPLSQYDSCTVQYFEIC